MRVLVKAAIAVAAVAALGAFGIVTAPLASANTAVDQLCNTTGNSLTLYGCLQTQGVDFDPVLNAPSKYDTKWEWGIETAIPNSQGFYYAQLEDNNGDCLQAEESGQVVVVKCVGTGSAAFYSQLWATYITRGNNIATELQNYWASSYGAGVYQCLEGNEQYPANGTTDATWGKCSDNYNGEQWYLIELSV